MNIFDNVYEIRIADVSDAEKIMAYIAEDWKKGHILSVNKGLFMHEFHTSEGSRLNIIIACRKDNGTIDGMLGYIPASNSETPDLWGSIWKIRNGSMVFLGNEIMRRLLEMVPHRYYASVGINRDTTGALVTRTMGYYVGRMRHWYMINDKVDYRIAIINKKIMSGYRKSKIAISEAKTIEDIDLHFDYSVLKELSPQKDRWYIKRRYFDYPIHKYVVYLIGESKARALLVMREVNQNSSRAVRIMDFVGDTNVIKEIGGFLHDLLIEKEYEYVDFYEHGFNEDNLRTAGFVERVEGDENIIPNYFAPFEQRNIEIYFHAPNPNYIFCKADGDQDRPN